VASRDSLWAAGSASSATAAAPSARTTAWALPVKRGSSRLRRQEERRTCNDTEKQQEPQTSE
jgi:hypothetical protein